MNDFYLIPRHVFKWQMVLFCRRKWLECRDTAWAYPVYARRFASHYAAAEYLRLFDKFASALDAYHNQCKIDFNGWYNPWQVKWESPKHESFFTV